MRFSLSFAVMR